MKARTWLAVVAMCIVLGAAGVAALNYAVDPYGLRDIRGRYLDFLVDDSPEIVKMRFDAAEYDLALLGSSRMLRMDPILVDSLSGLRPVNLSVAGASLRLNTLLLEHVKQRGKNFVCSFDCFMLNAHRDTYRRELVKLQRFRDILEQRPWAAYLSTGLFSTYTLRRSITALNRQRSGMAPLQLLRDWDAEQAQVDISQVRRSFAPNEQNKFTRYEAYPGGDIRRLAALADSNDIFVILPKYHVWYDHFDENGITAQYMDAIRTLVKTTRARVYCFYGRNELTRSLDNFDANGWHCKPRLLNRLSRILFSRIQRGTDAAGYGVLLDPSNVDAVLDSVSKPFPQTL